MSNLTLRIVTAFIGIPALLAVNYFGGYPFAMAIAAAGLVGAYEAYRIIGRSGYHPWVFAGMSATSLIAALPMADRSPQGAWIAMLLGLLIASGAYYLVPAIYGDRMASWALTLFPPMLVGLPLAHLSLLRTWPHGVWWVVAVFVITWSYDTGAYATGRLLGRRQFMNHVSSRKTREGVIGGLALGGVCSMLLGPALGLPPWQVVAMGLIGGASAQLGDLLESMLKRQARMKDSGVLVPGHGGLLDRIDSLLLVSVTVYYTAMVFGYGA